MHHIRYNGYLNLTLSSIPIAQDHTSTDERTAQSYFAGTLSTRDQYHVYTFSSEKARASHLPTQRSHGQEEPECSPEKARSTAVLSLPKYPTRPVRAHKGCRCCRLQPTLLVDATGPPFTGSALT